MIWGLFLGQNHWFDPFRTYLPPPMIYIVGKLWISASIWQRAIGFLSILQAVRILRTRWNRNEWLISDPAIFLSFSIIWDGDHLGLWSVGEHCFNDFWGWEWHRPFSNPRYTLLGNQTRDDLGSPTHCEVTQGTWPAKTHLWRLVSTIFGGGAGHPNP